MITDGYFYIKWRISMISVDNFNQIMSNYRYQRQFLDKMFPRNDLLTIIFDKIRFSNDNRRLLLDKMMPSNDN